MSNGDLTVDGNLYVTGFINGDGASNSNGTGITNLAAGNFATTFQPNDVLAGSLSGDGSVTFRPLTGSDLPLASATDLGILVPDVYSLTLPPNSLTGLSAQGWHTDVFAAPYMVGASTPDDAGYPDYGPPYDHSISAGVAVSAFTAWFPGLGRVSVAAFTLKSASSPALNPPAHPTDYILSHDGKIWHLDSVPNLGYPPFATMTATPPRLLIARITCSSAGITAIYDLRTRHPAPHTTHEIDLVALGADPTGKSDSTAAVQAALDMAAKGDGTSKIIVPPNSHILCCGQLVVRGNNRAGITSYNISNGIWLQGSPHGGQHQFIIAGGSVLDLRWDGGLGLGTHPLSTGSQTGLQTLGDYCVVSGYELSLGTYDYAGGYWIGPFAITHGQQDYCRAYINNTSSTDITTLGTDPGGFTLKGIIPTSLFYTKWYLDVDTDGHIYATQNGQWTDTHNSTPGMFPSYPVGGGASSSYGQSQTPDTIRVWAVYLDPNGNIVDYEDNRPFTGKLDVRSAGELRIDGLAFSAGYRGGWDPLIAPPYQIGDWVSWHGQPYRLANTAYAKTAPTTPMTPPSWINDVTHRDLVPLIRSTMAVPKISNCTFYGANIACPRGSAGIDAIHLAGPGAPTTISGSQNQTVAGFEMTQSGASYGGYGGVIKNCYFHSVRVAIRMRSSVNQTYIAGNYVDQASGAGDDEGAFVCEATSTVNPVDRIMFSGNTFESTFYPHTIRYGHNTRLNQAVAENHTDMWNGSLAPAGVAAGTTALPLNGTFNQNPDFTCWLGKEVMIGEIYSGGDTNVSLHPERVTLDATIPATGTPIGAGITTQTGDQTYSPQIDQMTIVLSGPLPNDPNPTTVLIGDGIANQECVTLIPATNPTQDNEYTVASPSAMFFTHGQGERVTQAPFTVHTMTPLQFDHIWDEVVSRSISAYRLLAGLMLPGSSIGSGATDPSTPNGQNYGAALQRRASWIVQANRLKRRIARNDQLAAAEEQGEGEGEAQEPPTPLNRAARRRGHGRP